MTGFTSDRCITCSDEAVEAEVVAVHGSEAIVRVAGTDERVAVDLGPRDDYVGTYALAFDTLQVTSRGGALYVSENGGPPIANACLLRFRPSSRGSPNAVRAARSSIAKSTARCLSMA